MEETFESIVRKWYSKLHRTFIETIMVEYNNININDAENIYQDVFIEIHRGFERGLMDKDTDWKKYIFSTGMQIARKQLQRDSIFSDRHQHLLELLIQMPASENDSFLSDKSDVIKVLMNELMFTPEPYYSIIRMKYFDNMTDEDIYKVLSSSGTEGLSLDCDIESFNSMLRQGMNDLSLRVKSALRAAELLDRS